MDEMKFKELMKNGDFLAEMLEAATIEEVKSMFSEKGITLTDGDLEQIEKSLKTIVDNNGSIPDENLESVSGGMDTKSAAAIGAGAGALGASAALMTGIYGAYKIYRNGVKKGKEECLEILKNSAILNRLKK